MELELPVSWLNSSSGRASSSSTRTAASGASSSSATSMATAVVSPWPTSSRGSRKRMVPSVSTESASRAEVGAPARMNRSPRSTRSAGAGRLGTTAWAGCGARTSAPARVTRASVGAATRYVRKERRLCPVMLLCPQPLRGPAFTDLPRLVTDT